MKNSKTKKLSLSTKMSLQITMAILLLCLLLELITSSLVNSQIDKEYMSRAVSLAKTVGVTLDKETTKALIDEVMSIYSSVDNKVGTQNMGTDAYDQYISNFASVSSSPNYVNIHNQLDNIRNVNFAKSIYIICIDPVLKNTVYIADSSDEPCSPGDFDTLLEINYSILDNPDAGFDPYTTNTTEYGWLVSAGSPIYDEAGNVIAYSFVDLSMVDIKRAIANFLVILFVVSLIAAAIICALQIIMSQKTIVSPINILSNAAIAYGNHEEDEIFSKVNIHTGDEIENLSDAMKRMEQDIKDYIANLTAVTAERERMGAELNVATKIQADMLPKIFPKFSDKKEYDVFASMNPAKEVGGDFYDVFEIDDSHLGLVVADVSGKGVPAALFMVIAKTLIKNRALLGGSPSEVLEYANNQLCEGNEAGYFVTVWFAILNIKTGKGVAANAGHEHPAIRRAGGEFELSIYKHSMAVATLEGLKFKEHEFELGHGDVLFCYTDGVTEATDANNELFGNDRLIEALNNAPDENMGSLCEGVKKSIDDFVGEAPQFDDITMLGIRFY
ncbi:HAMP/SpoIIE domain-containing protein [Butyrivibrio proteoclasticus B316]|uniref:HAMP/SpoIIE domain-containing protein n=1 Tax=Butyrivibrio proteoclasticus (strain ATCC 51982 / DSM 14932 / B316) TaxID=515622 RepID=E0RXF6_BUTPB|nr:PP2C family protein-serine/threonine phosphatase [Butyrivibrio proteoclasticus]ADL32994.1 HAMP/SpoIIE domain-containing protein [Butyrivibrio proteoclasticus B316]